jgi:pilus assembly protein CpaB
MNKRALIIALACAVVGVVLLQLYIQRFEEEVSGGDPVAVLIVRKDTPAGSVLTNAHVQPYLIPEQYISPRHIRGSDLKSVLGTRVSSMVKANEPLLWTDIAQMRQDRSLADLVQAGMVGVEVRASTFEGLLGPGDRVDVVFVSHKGEVMTPLGEAAKAVILLQSALVLSVKGKIQRDLAATAGGSGGAVTLLLTPEQAQLALVSQEHGKLALVLRNSDDVALRDSGHAVTTEDLRDAQRRARLAQAQNPEMAEGEAHAAQQ